MVMVVCGVAMLEAESRSSEPNITTGGDALWWSMVTITTVGYGDRYPVTMSGRVIATFVMVAGVGIIASLASILASVLIPPANPQSHNAPMATDNAVIQELASMRRELAELRQAIAAANAAPDS
jgi:voltage-gated potassium channel